MVCKNNHFLIIPLSVFWSVNPRYIFLRDGGLECVDVDVCVQGGGGVMLKV